MNPLEFNIIENIDEALRIWELFSSHQTIDDEWNFRYTFVKDLNFPFHFIVGLDQNKPVGLLPLQLNTLKGLGPKLLHMNKPFLEFFGGIDTDNNQVLLHPAYLERAEEFINQIKIPAVLTSLLNKYKVNGSEADFETDKFEVNLENLTNFEGFLDLNFSGKSKGKLINKIRYVHKNYQVEVKAGKKDDLDLLFEYSIRKFNDKSSFNMEDRRKIYADLFESFPTDLFTIYLDGVPKAVAFCIIYKKTYILLNVGYDHDNRDIGKLLVATQIQRAIDKGCTKYDAGKGDNGWKDRYHFSKIPQYKLELNLK